jgi:SAM-dependent methyltransferase
MIRNLQLEDVRGILVSNNKLLSFVLEDLKNSLSSIGFSEDFLNDLLNDLSHLDVKEFGEKRKDELRRIYSLGFFQDIVPNYFLDYVVPMTPSSKKIVDIGCGTGILAKLYGQDSRFKEVLGIDINAYPEWDTFSNEKIRFEIVRENSFPSFIKVQKPDAVVLTWTLHHMEYAEQERYIEYIHESLESGAKVIILEDSYSTNLAPENGLELQKKFMEWDDKERKQIMSVYDWVANRVLAQRERVPIPCAYRTLEGWKDLFEKKGFNMVAQKFIGFPDNRDINTPQSLLVVKRI